MSKYDTAGMTYPKSDFEPIPKGKYKVIATRMEEKPSQKHPNNRVIHCDLQVVEGEYQNKLLRMFINIIHHEEETQEKGVGDLKGIIDTVGESGTDDFSNLTMKPFMISVGVKEETWEGNTREVNKVYNVVRPKGYVSSKAEPLAGNGNLISSGAVVGITDEDILSDDPPF